MISKLLILSLIATSALANISMLVCTLTVINNVCTCNLLIFNPNGFNNLTVAGNPSPNCTLEYVEHAVGMGVSSNIPSAICSQLPKLEKLRMENIGIKSFIGNPFRNCGRLKTLLLGNNEIEAVPQYVFTNTILESLELNDNKLRNIDEDAFDNLNYLKTLNLNGNSEGLNLPKAVFDHLLSLQNLLVSKCGLTAPNPLWFANLRALQVLDLSCNNFTTIQPTIFGSQQILKFLDLSRGQLVILPEATFQNTTNLLILDLQSNQIKDLHPNLFSSLQLLQILYLSANPGVSIPINVFRSLSSLRSLELASNNIAEILPWFSSISSLVNINLSNNVNITSIPDNTFEAARALASINLSGNRITQLNSRSFGSLHALTSLDVRNNLINEVDHYLMCQSPVLKSVNFSGNNCTQISTENFSEIKDVYMIGMKVCFDRFDLHPIELTTFNSSIYNWYSIRSNDGWDALKISIKAYENVHIALSDSSNSAEPEVEIQIGQNRGRGSYILHEGAYVFNDTARFRLSETEARSFIIGWRFGIVMVFKDGDQFPFMAYHVRNKLSVNFFGLRTLIEYSDYLAEWKVSRIQESSAKELRDIYSDIEVSFRRKNSIDSSHYVR